LENQLNTTVEIPIQKIVVRKSTTDVSSRHF
jgi:hypothetical protein